jgi:hypothetical protein
VLFEGLLKISRWLPLGSGGWISAVPLVLPWFHADNTDAEHIRYSINATSENDDLIMMKLKDFVTPLP